MGQFDGIFSATANTDLSKNQFGSIFNDQAEFRKRQEEDRIRIEKQRQEEAQVKQQQEQRNNRPLSKKIGDELKLVIPTIKELPGVVKEAGPEFIKGTELGALQLATTGARTLSRLEANSLGMSQDVVDRLDMYAKKDREALTILQEEYAMNDPKTKKLANLNYLARGLGQTLTTMVPAIGAGVASSILAVPAAIGATVGAVSMAPLIFGEAWDQSKQAGKTDEEADLRAALTTVVIGALERIGLGKILKPSMAPTLVKRIIGKMGESIPTEVLTENIQNFADVAIGKSFGENKSFKDALQSIPETSVQTVLATIAFSGVVGVTQKTQGPNGMVLEEEKTELPFDPEAADIAPVIEETRKVVEQALQSIPEVEDTPETTTEAQNVADEPVLNSLNPTGSVFTNYTPKERASIKLGQDMTTLDNTSGKSPNETVTIYRGVPKGAQSEITAGDFVTTNKQLAKDYAGNGDVISMEVKMSDVLDSKSEPLGEEYLYRPQLRTEFKAQNVEATPTKKSDNKVITEKRKQLDPDNNSLYEAVFEMDQSTAGFRSFQETAGTGMDSDIVAQPSTFPKWVSESLRSRKLFDNVLKHLGNETMPKLGSRTGDLYTEVQNNINDKLGIEERFVLPADAGVAFKPPKKEDLQSRVYERLQQEHPEILTEDLTYTKNNMKADAIKAVALISKDKQKAYRVATGMEEAPKGQTATAVSIALGEKALSEGNTELYRKLTINRSLEQTRRGQEIVAEKGSVTDNSVARYVKELISTRLDKLGDSYLSDITEKITKKTTKQKATDILDREAKKIEAKIKSKKLDLKTALDLLNNHICV